MYQNQGVFMNPNKGSIPVGVVKDQMMMNSHSIRPDYQIPSNMIHPQSMMHPQQIPSVDMDTIIQVHRRKMQRRQANRRSAQLSRARKKAHLEELKEENLRLQHIVNILESQPEFIFSLNLKGYITYIPERISNLIRSATDDPEEEITHVNQILTLESVDILKESLVELTHSDYTKTQNVTFVKEVYYHDATGFPVPGYMRCTRLNKLENFSRKDLHNEEASDLECGEHLNDEQPKSIKKLRKGENYNANGSTSNSLSSTSDSNFEVSKDTNKSYFEDTADEFVCVIRPASASSPHGLCNLHLLSAASMVAHDSNQRDNREESQETRRGNGSGSPSNGSNSSGIPNSSLSTAQTKNSTSSEAGSEDNISNDP